MFFYIKSNFAYYNVWACRFESVFIPFTTNYIQILNENQKWDNTKENTYVFMYLYMV